MAEHTTKYGTAASRWAGVGPYYAMFPVEFADHVVSQYTSAGDSVLDPFAGRGTSLFSAAITGRCGAGIELNPVGWVYSQAKLHPAEKEDVIERVREIGRLASRRKTNPALPSFFSWCFSKPVRQFLVVAREQLNWRHCKVDWTLAAILMINLHGKLEASLSNQMRQTKAMSPDYAVNWWRQRNMRPPTLDPVQFLENRVAWRYAKGIPDATDSFVYLGDCTDRLDDVSARIKRLDLPSPRLLFTSPPYCGVTNYHYDQWLRRWLLGGEPNALAVGGKHRGKFFGRENYKQLLSTVFSQAKNVLSPRAVIYVRTDERSVTLQPTIDVLRDVFPGKRMFKRLCPLEGPTQTSLFGNYTSQSGEVDLVLFPRYRPRTVSRV
jgi:hypothetical protein